MMRFTIRHAMGLKLFGQMKLIAGADGLEREIIKIGILDYEYVKKTESDFRKGEFVLSSFLYAKDDKSKILTAVQKLCAGNASGMGIKNVFYDSLPQEVLDFADHHGFPLFTVDVPLYFEDLIAEFAQSRLLYSDYERYEKTLNEILNVPHTIQENRKLLEEIHRVLLPCFGFAFLKPLKPDPEENELHTLRCFHAQLPSQACAVRFLNGFLLIGSFLDIDCRNESQLLKLTEFGDLHLSGYSAGIGTVKSDYSLLPDAIREAIYAADHAERLKQPVSFWRDLGIFKLFYSNQQNPYLKEFCEDILTPIQAADEGGKNALLKTLETYFNCNLNTKDTAERLFQHENTIRYRINKIKSLYDSRKSELQVIHELYLAMQILHFNSEKHRLWK